VDPAARTQPGLGQLLIERGVLTPAQLERVLAAQKHNDKPLSELIFEHGLAERHMIEAALADHSLSQESNVIAFDSAARGWSGLPEEDAEWRRRLFDLAGSSDAKPPAESSRKPPKPRGFKRKLARNLEAYLARTAAELDERGEALQRRSIALAEELEQVSTAEAAVEERARRLRELDLASGELASRIDELLGLIGERDARLEALTNQQDDLGKRLELAQAGITQAEAVVAEREEQLLSREERIAQLLQEVEASDTSRRLAERNLAEREETMTRLQTANEAQLTNLAEVRDSLAGALAERAQRDDQLRSSESTRAAVAEELERTSARLRTAEQNVAEREERLAKLEAANAAPLDELGEVRGVLDERITRIAELEQELEQTGSQLLDARRKVQQLQSENSELASSRDQRVGELQTRFEGEVQTRRQHEARLGQLSARLVEREGDVSELQEKLGWRERELEGLRRDTDERNAALAEELDALRATLRATGEGARNSSVTQQDEPAPAPGPGGLRGETTYLCFVPIAGSYALVERSGPLPKPGDEITGPEYGGRRFLVSQVTQSPLPLDQRMCAYLLTLD
jgi:chromosome segregation ATPase